MAGETPPIEVVDVPGVKNALALLESEAYAAILLDLELPGAQGMDAFITLYQRAGAIPILVFAESADNEQAVSALRAGAQDFLTRAEVESPRLLRAVRYAIERHKLQRETSFHAEQLQFSEARFRLLINENADAILVVNRAGLIRFANPAAARLLGKSRQELVGTRFDAVLDRNAAATIEIPRMQDVALAEMRVVETLWNREQVYVATLRDVTEQQQIAAALQESEERYREFITFSSEGIWRTDLCAPLHIALSEEEQVHAILSETFIVECNEAMAQMHGYTQREEMLGRAIAVTVLPEDPVNREVYRTFIRNGYRVGDVETHEQDRFGNPKVFLNNIYGIVRGNYLVGLWGTQRDVTGERIARAELRRAEMQEKHQRELAFALADSAAALNSTLKYEQVLDRILENVGRVVPHEAASIFMIEGETALFVRGRGLGEHRTQELMEKLRLPIHEIRGFEQMFTLGKPLLIADTGAYADWHVLANDWIKSYLGAPLRVYDKTMGFLNLDSGISNFFTPEDAADLEAFAAQAATALENARLHTEAQRRADDFSALYDLTRELALQRDLDTLLDVLVERAMKLLNASYGALSLYSAETQKLEPRVVMGERELASPGPIKLGEGLMGRVVLSRQPILLDDYRTWEHRLEPSRGAEVSAVVAVPMMFGGSLIGVLAVHEVGDTPHRFTQADLQLLSLLGAQAAALVHNAGLHEETEKRAQQLALLYDAGLALNSVLEPEIQLDFLTRIAMRSVDADLAVFFRFDEVARELAVEFALGFQERGGYSYFQRISLDAPRGIEAWVARERLPALLNDTEADSRYAPGADGLASGVWVPIEHDNRLLGVLAVGSYRRNMFSAQDERLLLLYASQAAVALENARLYQEALKANERRAVLYWASQEIVTAGPDAERVYGAIHQATARLMPCESFVIALLDEASDQIELVYLYDRGGRHPSGVIPRARGISGHVIASGEPLTVDDLAASKLDVVNFGIPQQVSSLLAVPLRHGGKIVGMISAQAYEKKAFTADDRLVLEMLAAHAATAVVNLKASIPNARNAGDSLETDKPFL